MGWGGGGRLPVRRERTFVDGEHLGHHVVEQRTVVLLGRDIKCRENLPTGTT